MVEGAHPTRSKQAVLTTLSELSRLSDHLSLTTLKSLSEFLTP
jgi:hypothetical protein